MDIQHRIQQCIYYTHVLVSNLNVKIFPIFNYMKLWSSQSVNNRLIGLYDSYPNGEEMELYIPDLKYKPKHNYTFNKNAVILSDTIIYDCDGITTLTAFTFKTNFVLLSFLVRLEDYDLTGTYFGEYIFEYRL
jgi:hypothetical protein